MNKSGQTVKHIITAHFVERFNKYTKGVPVTGQYQNLSLHELSGQCPRNQQQSQCSGAVGAREGTTSIESAYRSSKYVQTTDAPNFHQINKDESIHARGGAFENVRGQREGCEGSSSEYV